ncbi:uncharacterized protein atf5a isoform X1 [Synchiropus splendidus]|uniref:uncharacterized protein atf5a isoform X1 n=1 Tax=Synchiropus splendidus TaxID=270530 RepID=UPI00237E2000|nr:uncharacterized protein atf5a isoform X1 [Synchiropus splendidus]
MATSLTIWGTRGVCLADPRALSHPQANSQSEGSRGAVPGESQHFIGEWRQLRFFSYRSQFQVGLALRHSFFVNSDGLSDWMTEEVDFSSYLPNPPSPPSSNGHSLPPSPLHHDIQVPSDLEVMTSLLQEELAQLEDYFLSDPLPEKVPQVGRCERDSLLQSPQSFIQLPYTSYPSSTQPEPSPLLVTLATGELDLLSICGGPVGRSKIPRPAPYSSSRPSGTSRKRIAEVQNGGLKGNNAGTTVPSLLGSYLCVSQDQVAGRSCGSVEVRRGSDLAREEKNCCFGQEGQKSMTAGFGFSGSHYEPLKKEDLLMFSMTEVSVDADREAAKTTIAWKSGESCYLSPQAEVCHGFLGNIHPQVKAEALQIQQQHHAHCSFLEDPGPDCSALPSDSPSPESLGAGPACRLKEDLNFHLDLVPHESGERKQKKRDQNKTAAHRYRQRKRAELESLEEQLHRLEGRNRELRDKAESVEREIQYVKDLLIEVYKARSQRSKPDSVTPRQHS